MLTLEAILVSLAGGVSASVGTFVWLVVMLVRRLRGLPAALTLKDMRRVWGVSAIVGIPVLFPWMPDFVVQAGESLLPYLYVVAVILLASAVSMVVGTSLCLGIIAFARLTGLLVAPTFDPMRVRWQFRLVWVASAVVGAPLVAGKTEHFIEVLAKHYPG